MARETVMISVKGKSGDVEDLVLLQACGLYWLLTSDGNAIVMTAECASELAHSLTGKLARDPSLMEP